MNRSESALKYTALTKPELFGEISSVWFSTVWVENKLVE